MNDKRTSVQRQEKQGKVSVRARSRSLKGGHDPAELGRRSGQRRREKARARTEADERAELDAAHDRIAVTARIAVVTASELRTADLRQLVRDLKERAHEGGHVGNRAAEQLLGLARAAVEADDDDTTGMDWSQLTPAQRAARRAQLDAIIAEMEEQAGRDEEEERGDPADG